MRPFLLGDKCKNCGVVVTVANGVFSGIHLRNFCRKCHSIRTKGYNSKRNLPAMNLMKRHGITVEEYNHKKELQLNGCAVCKQPCKTGRNLAVDHNHKTGVIRDLLCQRCNVILGLVNDDELLLFDLMDYLKRHEQKAS